MMPEFEQFVQVEPTLVYFRAPLSQKPLEFASSFYEIFLVS